jgi:hypothetical protein
MITNEYVVQFRAKNTWQDMALIWPMIGRVPDRIIKTCQENPEHYRLVNRKTVTTYRKVKL